ncbi:SMI1/KNR4 family protein [Nonomuraea sp. NPDC050783]|uniref:SMI1/KNR4 family protein n=1 Tax=Nonomuraea sp. NPDC050783 TaxID=3154634 RepID=UPI003467D48D
MLKLVRMALTAAVLTAIAIRLRRRARLPARPAAPARPARPARNARMGVVWAGIAAIVAVVLAIALVPRQTVGAAAAPAPGPAAPATPPTVGWTPPPPVPDPNCSPAPRPVAVRPIDPKVRRAVNVQWRRIERWLRANAPRTYRTLAGPGRAGTIAVAESQMGVDFPDDLRASLLRHNGSRGPSVFGFWFDGAAALSIRQIRDTWRDYCEWNDTDLGDDPATEYWNGRMIPFLYFYGRDSEDMEYAVVDSAGGAVGWDDTIGGMAPRLPSTYALLRVVADTLQRRTHLDGRRPVVVRGELRWKLDERLSE